MMTAVIFSGGDLPAECARRARSAADRADLTICADSGFCHARGLEVSPHIIVGDFDSYAGELPEDCEIHRSVPEKDDTDTLLAVKIAIERGCNNIELFGALGGSRFDHAFANIQTMIYAREHGCDLRICGKQNLALQGPEEGAAEYYRGAPGDFFSVFALTEKVRIISMTGVKYPLENYDMLRSYPIGVSNEITAEKAVISIENGLALIVFPCM